MFIPRNIKLTPAELWLNNKWEYLAYFILLPVGGVIYSDWCWPVCFLNNQIPHPRVSEQVILAGRAAHGSASKYSIKISSEGRQLKTGFAFCEKAERRLQLLFTLFKIEPKQCWSTLYPLSTLHLSSVFLALSEILPDWPGQSGMVRRFTLFWIIFQSKQVQRHTMNAQVFFFFF